MTQEHIVEPQYHLSYGLACAAASLIAGITQTLGWQLVNSNLAAIQGALGASAQEATWLNTAYFATFIPSVLLITKIRLQYGLRIFANVGVISYLAIAVLHLFTNNLASALMVRAAHGIAAASLSTMAILYMMQAFPKRLVAVGAILGFNTLLLGTPLARVVGTDLLEIGQWHGLYLLEVALAILCLAAVNVVKLVEVPKQDNLTRGDVLSFLLWAAGIVLLVVFITQGRLHWWRDTEWLGVCLAGSIAFLGLFAIVDLNRRHPLLDVYWLTSPYMLRFVVSIILFRIVASEQTVGVVGLLNVLGLTNDQMHGLFLLVLVGTVGGAFVALALAKRLDANVVSIVAAALIAAGAWMDSYSTDLTRVPQLYFTQTLLAIATSMFFSASVIAGLGKVLADGMKDMISFVAIFPLAQYLGSLAGGAWISTYIADRQEHNFAALADHISLADPQVGMRVLQLGGSVAGVITDRSQRSVESIASLAREVGRQAYVLAYNDLFAVIAAIAIAIMLWFLVIVALRGLTPLPRPMATPGEQTP